MAVLAKEEKSLKKQYKIHLIMALVIISCGICAAIWGNSAVIQILSLVILGFGFREINQFMRFFQGSQGETRVTRQLSKLPDNYIIINDTVIPNGKRTAQIDHILVADNSIFCIETKSHQGVIYGSETEHNWKQVKKRKYTNEFYNPIKQCMTHVMALKTLLKNNGFDIFVQPVIVFTTDSTVLKVTSKAPVLKLNQLSQYITGFTSNSQISDADKQKITDIIIKNSIAQTKGYKSTRASA